MNKLCSMSEEIKYKTMDIVMHQLARQVHYDVSSQVWLSIKSEIPAFWLNIHYEVEGYVYE